MNSPTLRSSILCLLRNTWKREATNCLRLIRTIRTSPGNLDELELVHSAAYSLSTTTRESPKYFFLEAFLH
jgi:hypothetical protein